MASIEEVMERWERDAADAARGEASAILKGRLRMPPWESVLDANEVVDLMKFLRDRFGDGSEWGGEPPASEHGVSFRSRCGRWRRGCTWRRTGRSGAAAPAGSNPAP